MQGEISSVDYKSEIDWWDNELALNGEIAKIIEDRSQEERYINAYPKILDKYVNIVNKHKKIPCVLDCGSGPLSQLVYGHHKKKYNLICTDILADEYAVLRKKHNFSIDYSMFNLMGEDLYENFGRNAFDIIWMQNAIDHAVYPKKILEQMSFVLRKHGYIILSGFANEGLHAQYSGLHKHDIYLSKGILMCKSYNVVSHEEYSLSEWLPLEIIESEAYLDNNREVYIVCYKKL